MAQNFWNIDFLTKFRKHIYSQNENYEKGWNIEKIEIYVKHVRNMLNVIFRLTFGTVCVMEK